MKVAVGCDHRGFALKERVMAILTRQGYFYYDFGCYNQDPVDYPDIALKVAQVVAQGEFDCGILICSTGIGMCIAANKVKGIRAALCHDEFTVRRAREHNNANILCLGGEVVKERGVEDIIHTFLTTPFEGGRHIPRLQKIAAVERE